MATKQESSTAAAGKSGLEQLTITTTKHATAHELSQKYANQIQGKTIIITGASPAGLGAEFAQAIAASSPAIIVLAGRSLSTLAQTAAAVKAVDPNVLTPIVELDLESQKSVRKAAAEINRWIKHVNVLVLNAGIMAVDYGKTPDGLERQFGTNHIGHFLFTNLLMPKLLLAGGGARVISVSSDAHKYSAVRFDDLSFGNGQNYDKWLAYGQSKTANVLFAVELARRYRDKGILAFSVHPGLVATGETGVNGTVTSGIGRHLTKEVLKDMLGVEVGGDGQLILNHPEMFKTLPEGAASHVYAAFDPDIIADSGSYVSDVSITNDIAAPHALDAANARKLWQLSEDLVEDSFAQ